MIQFAKIGNLNNNWAHLTFCINPGLLIFINSHTRFTIPGLSYGLLFSAFNLKRTIAVSFGILQKTCSALNQEINRD